MKHPSVCLSVVSAASLWFAAGATISHAATNMVSGAVLHLNMDEVRNGALFDLVTSNTVGRAANVRTMPFGKLAAALDFAARDSYVQIDDASALNPPQLTLALWFKNNREPWTSRYLVEKGAERGYALCIAGGGKAAPNKGKLQASAGGQSCFSDSTVNDDLWHHAAVTFDGRMLCLYVDGVLQKQTASAPGGIASGSHALTLGMLRSAPRDKEVSFEGQLDELMLFSRALTAEEIKQVRAYARPKFTKWQVERRLRELKELLDRGLILQEFYDRKVEECEVAE